MSDEHQSDPWADWDDPQSLDEYIARAGAPRGGYWTPYSVCAWVASRDDKFVAAVQAYEAEHHANRGSIHSSAAWVVLGDDAGARFGMNFTEAFEVLKEQLEDGRLPGGIATNLRSGDVEPIERHRWHKAHRTFVYYGVSLLPEFVDFRWPAKAVREAFPARPQTVSISPAPSNVGFERWMQRTPTGEQKLLVAFFKDAKNHLARGTDRVTPTQLLEKYEAWLLIKQKAGFALKRSAFELWLGRFQDGARPRKDGCGWEKVSE